MCLVRARTQHAKPNHCFNYTVFYFILLTPSHCLLLFLNPSFCGPTLPHCPQTCFLLSHFITGDYLPMELLLNVGSWMNSCRRRISHYFSLSMNPMRLQTIVLSPHWWANGRERKGGGFGVLSHRHCGRAESLDPIHSCARIKRWLRSRIHVWAQLSLACWLFWSLSSLHHSSPSLPVPQEEGQVTLPKCKGPFWFRAIWMRIGC